MLAADIMRRHGIRKEDTEHACRQAEALIDAARLTKNEKRSGTQASRSDKRMAPVEIQEAHPESACAVRCWLFRSLLLQKLPLPASPLHG
jgi:hypothetical protein